MTEASTIMESHLGHELGRLGPARVKALSIDPLFIELWELIAVACQAVLADTRDEDRWVRLESHVASALKRLDSDDVQRTLEGWTPQSIDRAIRRVKGNVYQRYAAKLVGAGAFNRLREAVILDLCVVVIVARRLLRSWLVFAQAAEDASSILPQNSIDTLEAKQAGLARPMQTLLGLDRLIQEYVLTRLPVHEVADDPGDLRLLDSEELAEREGEWRTQLSNRAHANLAQVSDALSRKLAGAIHALETSPDGISQAANSLVELVDRLLRLKGSSDEVVEWIEAHFPREPGLLWESLDGIRPTKRGEALRFVYQGGPPQPGADSSQPGALPLYVAMSLVAARGQLQELKHADVGTSEERARAERLLRSVIGALVLALRLGWLLAPEVSDDDGAVSLVEDS